MKWLLKNNLFVKLFEQSIFFAQVYFVHVYYSRLLSDELYAKMGIGLIFVAIIDVFFYYIITLPHLKNSSIKITEIKGIIFWYIIALTSTVVFFIDSSLIISAYLLFTGLLFLIRKLYYILNKSLLIVLLIDLFLVLRIFIQVNWVPIFIFLVTLASLIYLQKHKKIIYEFSNISYVLINILSGKLQMILVTIFFSSYGVALFYANRTVANLGNIGLELMPILILPYFNKFKYVKWSYVYLISGLILAVTPIMYFYTEEISGLMNREIKLNLVLPMIFSMPFILIRRCFELKYKLNFIGHLIVYAYFFIISLIVFFFRELTIVSWSLLPLNVLIILSFIKNEKLK